MKLVLRWEIDLILNKLNEGSGNYFGMELAVVLDYARKTQIDITVDEARRILKTKGPHPDTIFGNPLNRGAKYVWEENIEEEADYIIPQAIIDHYTSLGWNTDTTPWTPPS